MAKKGKTGVLGFLAFGAMILNAIAWLLRTLDITGDVTVVVDGLASISLVIVALVVAYDFAKRQTSIWRIIYWILAILTVCAILFGVGANFVN